MSVLYSVGEVAARDESLAAILGYLGVFDVRESTPDHASNAAVIEAELRTAGEFEPNLAGDVLIGGVARAFSAPVITRSVDHFARFDGVPVETY